MWAGRREHAPTIWQKPLFRARHKWVRRHAKHNTDLRLVDLQRAPDRADQISAGIPIGGVEPLADLAGELFQAPDQGPRSWCREASSARWRACSSRLARRWRRRADPWLELLLLDDSLRVAVDQSGQSLADLRPLRLHGGEIGRRGVRWWRVQTTAILLLESLRLLQQAAHLLPDGGLQPGRCGPGCWCRPARRQAGRRRCPGSDSTHTAPGPTTCLGGWPACHRKRSHCGRRRPILAGGSEHLVGAAAHAGDGRVGPRRGRTAPTARGEPRGSPADRTPGERPGASGRHPPPATATARSCCARCSRRSSSRSIAQRRRPS